MTINKIFKKKNNKWFIVCCISVLVIVFFSYILIYKSSHKEKYDSILSFDADIKGLDPTKKENTQTAVGNRYFCCVHDTLIGVDIQTGKLTNNLARAWAKDGDKVTFELREDAYFHNGEKVTYEDVEFSIKKGQENEHPQFINAVKEIKKINDNKFEVKLKDDVVFWHFYFTNFIRILNKKAIEKNPNEGIKVGAGPYKLKQWKQKESIELERFDKYYDKEFCQKGQEKLLIEIITDPDTALTKLEQGEIDAIIGYPSSKINDLKDNQPKNVKIFENDTFNCSYCYINKQSTSLEARKAIFKALDVPKYIQDLKLPVQTLESYIPKGLIGHDKDLQHHPTDIQGAKNIVKNLPLQEKKLKLVVSKGASLGIPNKIVEDLKEVGFEAQLEILEFNILIERSEADNSDINMLFIGEFHETLYGHKALEDYFSGGSDNFCHVDEQDIPNLKNKIEIAKITNNEEEYAKTVKEINKYIHDQFYVIPLSSNKSYILTKDNIKKGFESDSFARFDITKIRKE
jgi:peptide/nickel transport system substrate-binding protein